MGCPFGRVWDTRGPGASFEPESTPPEERARAARTIDDARTYHGRESGSACALPGSPFPRERAGLITRREAV